MQGWPQFNKREDDTYNKSFFWGVEYVSHWEAGTSGQASGLQPGEKKKTGGGENLPISLEEIGEKTLLRRDVFQDNI